MSLETFIKENPNFIENTGLLHLYEELVKEKKREFELEVERECAYDSGRFPFIPLQVSEFLNLLDKASKIFTNNRDRKPRSFIDLGCGFGNNMILARHKGLFVQGVEIDETYINFGREILPNAKFIQGNLLNWRPHRKYDIAYFYKPLYNHKLWLQFQNHFVKSFPKGQIFISPLGTETWEIPGIIKLQEEIFQIV